MRCRKCLNENGPLIRGLCSECDPLIHAVRQEQARIINEAEDMYEAKTGKKSLDDWSAFERFLENDLTPRQQQTIVDAFLGPCLW